MCAGPVRRLNARVAESDLAVFASPTYNATFTGLLKAFLDRYRPVNVLAGDQHELANQFARSGTDTWAGVDAWPGGSSFLPHLHLPLSSVASVYIGLSLGDHRSTAARVSG